MIIRKMRLIAVAGLVLMLTFGLAAGAVAAEPEPAGGLRWIVQFEDEVNWPAKQRILDNAGGVLEEELEALDMAIVFLPSKAAARGLHKEKGVRWVEEDSYKHYHLQPKPWGVDRIDAEEVWPGNTGDGVNVAMLDTGIDTDHLDLAENLEGRYSAVNRDTSNVEDKNGHGTHTAGIIAALNNDFGVVGVGPAIDLYAVQISRGTRIRLSDILEGINWCIGTLSDSNPDNNIQVMSMSYGGGYSSAEASALKAAYEAGIVLVSSAGNASGGAVSYPAALDWVIAVSAVDKDDQIASFSSTGPDVELAAPGVSIYSTYKGGSYAALSGTSMACPHVSGVAALYIASNPGSTPEQVRLALQTSAEDLGATGKDNLYGYGLVDAENAVLGTTNGNNLAPPATGAIDGTVTVAGTDPPQPIAGATVTADGYTTMTASDGTYTLAGLPVDSYTVTASATGYESQSITDVTVAKDGTTTVDFALTPSTVPTGTMHVADIAMWYTTAGPNRFIYTKVTIVDATGTSVPEATVYLDMTLPDGSTASGSGETNGDGTVTFKLKSQQTGTYESTVTNVVKGGWYYDSEASVTSGSITVL
jgi:hypothetical protein